MLSQERFPAGFVDAKTCRAVATIPHTPRYSSLETTMRLGNNVVGSRRISHLNVAASVLLGLLPLPTEALAGPPPPFSRCDGEPAARTLGVLRHDWQVACLRLDDTRRVIAAVPLAAIDPLKALVARSSKPVAAAPAPPLVVRVALAKGDAVVWRDEMRFDQSAPSDLREVLDKSEEWLVGIDGQNLGPSSGVRIGVMGHWGSEAMSVREIALLYRLPSDSGPLKLLWSGLGNTRESRSDYCLIEGMASFQLVDDRTIERQMRLTPIINRETQVPRRRARALEKSCVVTPQPNQRFAVRP
jgi:hypothetical protein